MESVLRSQGPSLEGPGELWTQSGGRLTWSWGGCGGKAEGGLVCPWRVR